MTSETEDKELLEGDELLYFNGIDGDTGQYALPPMTGNELSGFIRQESQPENLAELRYRYEESTKKSMGVREGIDPKQLDQTGWGVIFSSAADPAVKEALTDLLNLRNQQAGKYFKVYEGGEGYRPDESKAQFLARHGAGARIRRSGKSALLLADRRQSGRNPLSVSIPAGCSVCGRAYPLRRFAGVRQLCQQCRRGRNRQPEAAASCLLLWGRQPGR